MNKTASVKRATDSYFFLRSKNHIASNLCKSLFIQNLQQKTKTKQFQVLFVFEKQKIIINQLHRFSWIPWDL